MNSTYVSKQKRQLYKARQKKLGQTLRKLRKDSGLKQGQLAKVIGIAQPDVSKIENGERLIRFTELDLYAYALDMTVGEFVKCLLEEMLETNGGLIPDEPLSSETLQNE